MQRGINKVIIVGNVGADPEVVSFDGGGKIANLTIATSEHWKDKDGNPQERTDWHRIVANGGLAEVVEKYVKKGAKLYCEGSLRTRKYTDNNNVERWVTEIIINGYNGVL